MTIQRKAMFLLSTVNGLSKTILTIVKTPDMQTVWLNTRHICKMDIVTVMLNTTMLPVVGTAVTVAQAAAILKNGTHAETLITSALIPTIIMMFVLLLKAGSLMATVTASMVSTIL